MLLRRSILARSTLHFDQVSLTPSFLASVQQASSSSPTSGRNGPQDTAALRSVCNHSCDSRSCAVAAATCSARTLHLLFLPPALSLSLSRVPISLSRREVVWRTLIIDRKYDMSDPPQWGKGTTSVDISFELKRLVNFEVREGMQDQARGRSSVCRSARPWVGLSLACLLHLD